MVSFAIHFPSIPAHNRSQNSSETESEVTITEEQRSKIYLELADKISPEGAEFLMAQIPPGGWERLATKSDLKEFATKSDLKEFATKSDLKEFATKSDLKEFATKSDLKEFATKSDLKELATKFEGLSVEFRELKAYVITRFAEFEVKTEQKLTALEVRMEQGFAKLEARRSRDVWAFAAAVVTIMVTVIVSVAFIG